MLPLILLFGEMTPKSLAIRLGEPGPRCGSLRARLVMWLVAPRASCCRWRRRRHDVRARTADTRAEGLREEEFRALVDVGSEEGELQVAERRLIHNVFEFGDNTVGQGDDAGRKVFALPYEMPLGRLVETVAAERYSRVPIYKS